MSKRAKQQLSKIIKREEAFRDREIQDPEITQAPTRYNALVPLSPNAFLRLEQGRRPNKKRSITLPTISWDQK